MKGKPFSFLPHGNIFLHFSKVKRADPFVALFSLLPPVLFEYPPLSKLNTEAHEQVLRTQVGISA